MNNYDNTSPIGFFDSGVGGLSVFSNFRKKLPNEHVLYFGDLIHLPYGNKTQKELIGFAVNILNFFKKQGVKAVVIACNTSSAQAYETVKNDYDFKIYPIIQSSAKVIAETSGITRVGVFATEATVNAGTYSRELKKYNPKIEVKELARKNWVSIVEKTCENFDKCVADIRQEVNEMLEFNPDKIILGCTHYPYLMKELKKYADESLFIDPADIFTDYIKTDLAKSGMLNPSFSRGEEQFYVSANPEDFVKNAEIFYKINKNPVLCKL